jgi:hypothetical protein
VSGAVRNYLNVEGVGALTVADSRSTTTIIGMRLVEQLGNEMVTSAYSVDLRST